MKILVATDAHIYKTLDGKYWCGAIYSYDFWTRFMNVYDSVRIVARVKEVENKEEKWRRVDGIGIEVFEIPFYQGPLQLAKKYFSIIKSLKNVYEGCEVAIFRVPSPTAQLVWNRRKKSIPTGLEVVYDLTDDLSSPTSSVLRKAITKIQIRLLKKMCKTANGVSYVTEYSIQKNFPSRASIHGNTREYFETFYSTITLKEEAYGTPKNYVNKSEFCLALVDVSMNSYRKGEKILLNVVRVLRERGYDVRAVIMGDGSKKEEFERYAKELNIENFVLFTGLLSSSDEVRDYLNKSDIFVFPTEAEGLPRGILEAMAVGLPVVASSVGGIPEIIEKEYLVRSFDVGRYAEIIESMINSPQLLNQISQRNIEIAKKYCDVVLQARREEFYKKLYALHK